MTRNRLAMLLAVTFYLGCTPESTPSEEQSISEGSNSQMQLDEIQQLKLISDCESCNAALDPELKTVGIIINKSEIIEWLSEYFSSSETKRQEMKTDRSTSAAIGAIVKSIPIKFEFNNSSSKMDKYWYSMYITWTREKFISIDELYYSFQSSLPPIAWDKWLECKRVSCGGEHQFTGVELKISQIREEAYLIELWNYSDNEIKISSVDFDYLTPKDKDLLAPKVKVPAFKGGISVQAVSGTRSNSPFTISINYQKQNGDKTIQLVSKPFKPMTKNNDLPIGTIVAWSPPIIVGSSSMDIVKNIPEGWVICDGRDSRAPNLKDRFLKGMNNLNEVKDTGGSTTHSHTGTTDNDSKRYHHTDGRTNLNSPNPHQHTFTTNATEVLPPYYSVVYIMKVE